MRIFLCFLVLAAFAGLAVADENVTGKWSGSFNMIGPDGQTKDSTAVLVLKQNGSEITGTVGPNEGEQHEITKGKIAGDKITLETADGEIAIKFELAVAGDRMTGDANATGEGRNLKAKIDVKREK
ncbi:MAG TPA: hypothetical protein VMJ75_07425 [Candidatus Acidoferrales bacterium]|nr:hypothetical protein [Candidatus Acidoferrales bacterium]HXK03572.1 hypothetical protein [Verrucomicrobiae bacterium]